MGRGHLLVCAPRVHQLQHLGRGWGRYREIAAPGPGVWATVGAGVAVAATVKVGLGPGLGSGLGIGLGLGLGLGLGSGLGLGLELGVTSACVSASRRSFGFALSCSTCEIAGGIAGRSRGDRSSCSASTGAQKDTTPQASAQPLTPRASPPPRQGASPPAPQPNPSGRRLRASPGSPGGTPHAALRRGPCPNPTPDPVWSRAREAAPRAGFWGCFGPRFGRRVATPRRLVARQACWLKVRRFATLGQPEASS